MYLKNSDPKSCVMFQELRGGWNVGSAQFALGANIAYNLHRPVLPTRLLYFDREVFVHRIIKEIGVIDSVDDLC